MTQATAVGISFLVMNRKSNVDDSRNLTIFNVNTIANYDPDIIPLLDKPVGTAWARDASGKFVKDRINLIE
jgi:hypothetical protein